MPVITGVNYLKEYFRQNSPDIDVPRSTTGEAMGGVKVESFAVGRFRLLARMQLHPNFVTLGRYRATFEGGLRMPLTVRFNWSLRLFDRFDSKPPGKVQRNDYGVISAFGVAF